MPVFILGNCFLGVKTEGVLRADIKGRLQFGASEQFIESTQTVENNDVHE